MHHDPSKTYKVGLSRVTTAIVALISYGVCGLLAYCIATNQLLFFDPLFKILMAILMGIIGLVSTYFTFRPPVLLELDDQGIRLKTPPIKILWNDIRGAEVLKQGIKVTVELAVFDIENYLSQLTTSQRKAIDYEINSGIIQLPLIVLGRIERLRNEIEARLVVPQSSMPTMPTAQEAESPKDTFTFNIRYLGSLFPDRLYRVYYTDKVFYMIRIAGQGGGDAAFRYGMIGFLFAKWANSGSKTPEEIAEMDQKHPEELLSEHKHNFKFTPREVMQANIKPPSSLNTRGAHTGFLALIFTDGKKMQLQFEDTRHMRCAVTNLPAQLGSILKVDVQWNEDKKKFVKVV